jgi:hypothetical protein
MWLKLVDPGRVPSHWLEIIQPGQYCVFILDASVRVPKDFNGHEFQDGEAAVEIAPDLASAEQFALTVVTRHPELCCEIYGSEGKSGEPIRTVYESSVRGRYEGLPWAKRQAAIGATIISVGIALIVYDARHELRWMWGYIIGAKLLIIGGSFLVRGIAGICEHHFQPGLQQPKAE